jgi:hypothetical protein
MKQFLLLAWAAALALAGGVYATNVHPCHSVNDLPDSKCTPGVVRTTDVKDICTTKTGTIRPPASYTSKLKLQQMKGYGFSGDPSTFEEDHLISLELGGDPKDPKNLWPEPGGSLLKHLQHAPIQITIPGSNPIHAVCLVAIVGDVYYYYDSYAPFLKSMSTPPASALKVVLYDSRIVMRQIGWADTEKGRYVGFDTPERQQKFDAALLSLFPDYRLEEKEWNLGKRPW